MLIKKSLNDNAVIAVDKDDSEFILFGKGIGYGKKVGDVVDESVVNQTFIPLNDSAIKDYISLLASIPPVILEITRSTVEQAKKVLKCSLNTTVYFMLSDHLNFAIERQKNGIIIQNRVFWEIKTYYPDEFEIGQYALALIKKELGITLADEEAANIAFHIINAQSEDGVKKDSMNYANLISSVISIVRHSIGRQIYTESIHYQRFITHLKFFSERFFSDSMLTEKDDSLFEQIAIAYPKSTEIAFMVKDYLTTVYDKQIPKEEITYLSVHINRLIKTQEIDAEKNTPLASGDEPDVLGAKT
ncbi:transcriptional antiterminator bglG:CAT RNA-binding region [Lactococcus piscium]|uniref:Transcriptional antiterminator bglG:CAT RNA-binding region n=1 Tax=Pseudolactococcus piscium TaxID=1364 RepID=A0A2A5S5Z0_9LACT|nr:PRD domain-containing protein [Lactococcus piscium]PCS08906.1 transcriptional antiterminator bglG:CAT RNA-binding region [Lactococcus piscium]